LIFDTMVPPNAAPTVSVVIPAFGAPDALRATLDSLYHYTSSLAIEVVVVDSGASICSVRSTVADSPAAYVPATNRGFAAACNIGIRQARGELVVLLNPDVLFGNDALGALVRYLLSEPRAGCAGPKLLRRDGSVQPYAFGFEPSPGLLLRRALGRLAGRQEVTQARADRDSEPFDVDWVAGTCLIARRELFSAVGLLDERYFLYWEDVDWCLRVKRGGWRVVFHPGVAVTHLGGSTVGWAAARHYYRSLVRFYRKWYGGGSALLLAALLQVYGPLASVARRLRAYRD
jgi:GT2 family glycosyltransferase